MRKKITHLIFILSLFYVTNDKASASELKITVTGIKTELGGSILLAIFNDESHFNNLDVCEAIVATVIRKL